MYEVKKNQKKKNCRENKGLKVWEDVRRELNWRKGKTKWKRNEEKGRKRR